MDTGKARYADLVGDVGTPEASGEPPYAARHVAKDTHPHRLPSVELEALIYEYEPFGRYLVGAILG